MRERAIVCDPTGWAVATCSSTMAWRIAALRSSSSIGTRSYRVPPPGRPEPTGRRARASRRADTSLASRRPGRVSTTRPSFTDEQADVGHFVECTRPPASRRQLPRRNLDPVPGAQGQGERLGRLFLPVEPLLPRLRRDAGADGLDVALRGAQVPEAPGVLGAPRVAVGRAADRGVVALAPVQEVVAALLARPGPVRDLVPGAARRGEHVVGELVLGAWSSSSGAGRAPAATALPSGVPGSTVSAYALTCSGSSASASVSVASQSATDSPGVP